MRITRRAVMPQSARLSMASASEQSTASTAARARFSGVVLTLVRPRSTPLASGPVGAALAVQVGQQDQALRPGGRG